MAKKPTLTTTAGARVGDNENCITAGPGGPVLLQDQRIETFAADTERDVRGFALKLCTEAGSWDFVANSAPKS